MIRRLIESPSINFGLARLAVFSAVLFGICCVAATTAGTQATPRYNVLFIVAGNQPPTESWQHRIIRSPFRPPLI
jgi:hypothetical protein